MRRLIAVSLVVALGAVSCGRTGGGPSRQLTERQRDSILATEKLPGAGVVGRALAASDTAAAQAARMDSLP